ncbi:hypothetical protein Hanom_Chr00s000017g01616711 [Helianthus anomalus]
MKATLVVMNIVKIFDVKLLVSVAKYDKNHRRFNYTSEGLGRNEWRPKEVNLSN